MNPIIIWKDSLEGPKKLMFRAGLVKGSMNIRFILFSASGFDEDLKEYLKRITSF